MDTRIVETRSSPRVEIDSEIKYSQKGSDEILRARMGNISERGMYFECRFVLPPHSDVCIWLGNSLPRRHETVHLYEFYRSRVRWCRPLSRTSLVGVGVEHVVKSRLLKGPDYTCSICDEKIPIGKVHFVKDFVYVCDACHGMTRNWEEKELAEYLRFLEGNVI